MLKPQENQFPKILFIDDEEMLGLAAEMMTMGQPYNLISFTSAAAALKYLAKHKDVGLIFVDYLMPEISGSAFLKEIRSNSDYDHIPAIIQSGLASQEIMDEIKNATAQDYILKPYSKEAFLSLITQYLPPA